MLCDSSSYNKLQSNSVTDPAEIKTKKSTDINRASQGLSSSSSSSSPASSSPDDTNSSDIIQTSQNIKNHNNSQDIENYLFKKNSSSSLIINSAIGDHNNKSPIIDKSCSNGSLSALNSELSSSIENNNCFRFNQRLLSDTSLPTPTQISPPIINNFNSSSRARTNRSHPNIHHHPTIHPHNHKQRPSISINNLEKMPEECSTTSCMTSNSTVSTPNVDTAAHGDAINFDNTSKECIDTENCIRQIQELIDKLNFEIFKNPRNYTRPPSEYLEIYNTFTEQLHNLQKRKETLDQINSNANGLSNELVREHSFENSNHLRIEDSYENGLSNSASSIPSSPTVTSASNYSDDESIHSNNNYFYPNQPHNQQHHHNSTSYINRNVNRPNHLGPNRPSEIFDAKKPPLPKNGIGNGYNSTNVPKFKLDYSNTSLNAFVNTPVSNGGIITTNSNLSTPIPSTPTFANNNNNSTTKHSPSSTSNNTTTNSTSINSNSSSTPITTNNNNNNSTTVMTQALPLLSNNYTCSSSCTSPATTPNFFSSSSSSTNNYLESLNFSKKNNDTNNPSNYSNTSTSPSINSSPNNTSSHLTTSASSTSLYNQQLQPQQQNNINNNNNNNSNNNHLNSSNNSNIAHNSRSFGDINDVINITPTTSLSPSSSIATTPTYGSLSSSFLRIFIGSSTAVVEKKPVQLKDALYSKLKSRNLEIDKCIAYIKDTNVKIEWETEVNKLTADNIVVAELGDEIRHSFEKKTFSLRSCDSCKRRFMLNAYACTKCDYTMCHRNDCRPKSERIVCVPRKITSISSSSVSSMSSLSKPEINLLGPPESPIRETSSISQQILPVHQLKVNIPSRDRSRSETELNMFTNTKLTSDTTRPVQKSPTTLVKSNVKNSIYGTIPRNNPYTVKPTNNILINDTSIIDDISGSVNEESGSVISSINKAAGPNSNKEESDTLGALHSSTSPSVMISSSVSSVASTNSISSQISSVNVSNGTGAGNNLKPTEITNKTTKTVMKLHKPSRRDSFNTWEIPFHQIKIDMSRKVGSGSFGIVHKGRDFYHGTVAIKFLNVQNPTPHQSHAFRNEVAILKSTRHDNILLFIGCILKPYLAIVTEWCPGSSLYRHIHVEEEHWEMHQLCDIAKQTATGMEYLHARDILHRDLKSNNIFLIPKEAGTIQKYRHHNFNSNKKDVFSKFDDFFNEQEGEKWTVKIGDFGLATVKSTWTQSSSKTTQPTGSILWMAPEVITQKVPDPYTQKSDVYSFAVVLYELVTGHLPYLHKEQNMILFLVGSGRLKPDPEDSRQDTPNEIKELITICSHFDRDKRFDFVEINEKLKKIKLAKLKSKLQRAQSLPNFSITSDQLNILGMGMFDEEMYPGSPNNLDAKSNDLYDDDYDDSENTNNSSNNTNSKNNINTSTNTINSTNSSVLDSSSQQITNL